MARTHDTGIRILAIERMLGNGRRMKLAEIQQELAQKMKFTLIKTPYARTSTR